MYLSRMLLDTTRRTTMLALSRPNQIHGAIESSFPGERTRKLWRIDTLNGNSYLLLLSNTEPDLTKVYKQFGPENSSPTWETKEYSNLLARISDGSTWHFRLVASPIRALAQKTSSRGKVKAHITVEQMKKWLLDRAERNGFTLEWDLFDVVKQDTKKFYKGADRRNPVTISEVTFEGILKVTDADLFRKALCNGIGKGKAYGLGMLTVVRNHG